MRGLFCKPLRLSVRLTLTYAVVFTAILAILSIGMIWGANTFMRSEARYDAEQIVGMIHQRLLDEYYEGEPLDDPEVMQGFDANPALNVALLDPMGAIITNHRNFEAHGKAIITRIQAVYDEGALVATIQIERSLMSEQAFLSIMTRLLLIFDAVGILFALCFGMFVARRMLHPIQTMTDAARRISMNALDERLVISSSRDELTGLADTFNSMLDRLQAAFDRQNRFVSDASHELRTPLMVIQGYTDVLERWGMEDKAILEQSIHIISQEAVSMNELIEKLLFLARGDAGRQAIQATMFSATTLAEELKREYAILAPSHTLTYDCAQDTQIVADRSMVKQMLRALLDNAVKYTPDDQSIQLSVRHEDDEIQIIVADHGKGIASEDLPHIFDRFYRADQARAKATGGNGLGLSVVQWIAQAHDGRVDVESKLSEGSKFIVHLPTKEIRHE